MTAVGLVPDLPSRLGSVWASWLDCALNPVTFPDGVSGCAVNFEP